MDLEIRTSSSGWTFGNTYSDHGVDRKISIRPLSDPPWGEGRNPWKRDKVIAVQSMKYAGGHTVRGVGRRWKWRRALTRRERGRKEGGRKIRQGLAWTRLGGGFPRIISFNYWKMSGWITSYLLLSFFFFFLFFSSSLPILTDESVERQFRGRTNFSKFRFRFFKGSRKSWSSCSNFNLNKMLLCSLDN